MKIITSSPTYEQDINHKKEKVGLKMLSNTLDVAKFIYFAIELENRYTFNEALAS